MNVLRRLRAPHEREYSTAIPGWAVEEEWSPVSEHPGLCAQKWHPQIMAAHLPASSREALSAVWHLKEASPEPQRQLWTKAQICASHRRRKMASEKEPKAAVSCNPKLSRANRKLKLSASGPSPLSAMAQGWTWTWGLPRPPPTPRNSLHRLRQPCFPQLQSSESLKIPQDSSPFLLVTCPFRPLQFQDLNLDNSS